MTFDLTNIGILVSGRGSNMQAIIEACAQKDFPARVCAVVSDNPGATALQKARDADIPALAIERKSFADKRQFEDAIVAFLKSHAANLVCLAGYMRLVGKDLLGSFPDSVMNIHPSLLPAFPGLDAQRQAIESGAKKSGCTVHLVDELMDHGPIILQAAVDVLPGDTHETLAERILKEEHKLYPQAIRLFAEKRLHIRDRRVYIRQVSHNSKGEDE